MTPTQLASIGRKLYGETWKGRLAEELGWSRFTIYRWAAGKTPVHESAVRKLRELDGAVRKRKKEAGG